MSGWRVTGHPTPAELAAVVAAVDALRSATPAPAPARPAHRDGWGAPADLLRAPFPPADAPPADAPSADPEEDPR
ncbi:acyl-CoA carboxylase epsilon subunit [Kineococcus terrestris]|uniref:acyl-CoA carboxylase epsilon subunit n=1 Tax=Kineococcus terrestris TaxID=2044856 RepID=UPI0034DB19EC